MYIEPLKFAATGIINTLVSFIIYSVCLSVFRCNYIASLILAYIFGILNSYVWNSKWTFKTNKMNYRELARFTLVYISTFIINLFILAIEIKIIKINGLVSQGIALTIAAFFSFIGYKYWVFRKEKEINF